MNIGSDKMSAVKKDKNLTKNYIILVVVFLLVIGLTVYLCRWYRVYNDYKKQTPVIRGVLQEIVPDDLEHYVLENPSTVIYMCTSISDDCRNFEKGFSKYVVKKGLSNEIIYLNLTNYDNDKFISDFNDKYKFRTKLNGMYPSFVVFKDGNVTSVLQKNSKSDVSLGKVKSFLELNEIEGEYSEDE